MASTITMNSAQRARSYVFRLPLWTRGVIIAIAIFWAVGVQSIWDLRAWGALVPDKLNLATLYRLNTFPFIHLNFLHAFLNILAITPLMERFESEYGTLTTFALFFGPLTTVPGVLYILLERVLGLNTSVMGASMWVFLLLGIEAMRTFRTNPYLSVGPYNIPTWTVPLAMVLCIAVLVPGTSLIGHMCGLGVGYVCGLGYLKYLAPPEPALRWIEGKLNLLGRLPHYVSVDQKTYGRFGVLPTVNSTAGGNGGGAAPIGMVGSTQRLGP